MSLTEILTQLIAKRLVCPEYLYYKVQHPQDVDQLGTVIVRWVDGF